jgi:hypothetical protein
MSNLDAEQLGWLGVFLGLAAVIIVCIVFVYSAVQNADAHKFVLKEACFKTAEPQQCLEVLSGYTIVGK